MRTLLIAWQGIIGDRVRSALIVVALTLGMLGFVTVLSARTILVDAVTQRALLSDGPAATVEVTLSAVGDRDDVDLARTQLQRRVGAESTAIVSELPEVGIWSAEGMFDRLAVSFVSPDLIAIRPFPVVDGSWLRDAPTIAPRAVVNEAARTLVDGAGRLDLGTADSRTRVVVSGVVRDGQSEPRAYVGIEEQDRWARDPDTIRILVHGPTLTESDVRSSVVSLGGLGAQMSLETVRRVDRVEEYAEEIAATSRILLILGALSLASTIVGIANVSLATARTREREFVLRRTVGARRTHLAIITVIESQILALGAAAIAFAGSFLLYPVVVQSFGALIGLTPPPYSALAGLIALGVASVSAFVSSLVPTIAAGRQDISSVMRE